MTDSFNDPLHLLLLDSLWHKSDKPCLANFASDLEPEQERQIKPDPDPEPNPEQPEPERGHSPKSTKSSTPADTQRQPRSVYNAWLASRVPSHQNGGYITAGAQRPLTRANLRLAHEIAELCVPQMLHVFWSRHPFRAFVMVAVSFVRGTFPVFKGYTHALIINEVCLGARLVPGVFDLSTPLLQIQSLLSSGHYTWSYLIRLLGAEFLRVTAEKSLDLFA
jgi:hypothetical protein